MEEKFVRVLADSCQKSEKLKIVWTRSQVARNRDINKGYDVDNPPNQWLLETFLVEASENSRIVPQTVHLSEHKALK